MCGGWAVAIVVAAAIVAPSIWQALVCIVGVGLIAATGVVDDAIGLRAKVKLALQLMVATAIFSVGVGHRVLQPLSRDLGVEMPVDEWWLLAASLPVVLVIVAGACNASNFIDGVDGLCSGVGSIVASSMLSLSVYLAVFERTESTGLLVAISAALVGVTASFLRFNRPPAAVFMGDCGSLLIGMCVGLQLVLLLEHGPRWFFGGLMFFGLPTLDAAMAIVRRVRQGRSPFVADNWHLHHLLLRRGLTPTATVSVMYLLSASFALSGVMVMVVPVEYTVLHFVCLITMFIAMGQLLGLPNGQKPES